MIEVSWSWHWTVNHMVQRQIPLRHKCHLAAYISTFATLQPAIGLVVRYPVGSFFECLIMVAQLKPGGNDRIAEHSGRTI